MTKRTDSEAIKIILEHGEGSLSDIIEDLAKQTVQKEMGRFISARKRSLHQAARPDAGEHDVTERAASDGEARL